MEAAIANETELLKASLGGSQQAFGRIVERYQSLICAIAYSATGDLGLSEDLAQETFLTAWNRLAELRDAAKLRAWLCGIVRNLARNAMRRRRRDATGRGTPLEEVGELVSPAATPRERAIRREEEALLWGALEEMPETYREPLVLYYREGQSMNRVAAALDLSEDAVKQRLSRGRKMLKEQVATFVEETLERTRPGKAFAVAVLAALPAAAPQAAAAGVAAMAGKGSAAAKSVAAAGLSGAILGPVIGLLGAFLGARASIVNTKSSRERRFMIQMTVLVLGLVVLFGGGLCALIFGMQQSAPEHRGTWAGLLIGLVGIYLAGLVGMILWGNRRQRQIQIEDGTYVDPREILAARQSRPQRLSKGGVYGSLAGAIFGGVCWIFPMAFLARDWMAAAATLIVAAMIYLVGTQVCLRSPRRYWPVAIGAALAVGILNLAVVNLRWNHWMVFYRESPHYQPSNDWPLWAVNGLIVLIVGCLVVLLFGTSRSQRKRFQSDRNPGGK